MDLSPFHILSSWDEALEKAFDVHKFLCTRTSASASTVPPCRINMRSAFLASSTLAEVGVPTYT